ncbi:MAG TPA: hypothetical protein VF277_02385 [Steroidobacteraceae bacterium]
MPRKQDVARALLALTVAALVAGPATAATAKNQPSGKSGEVVYRCKDERGRSIMGQAIPAECMDADVDVLDRTGRVVRTIPGRRSMEQINQQKADADAVKAAQQRDRTLLATYLTVEDIERLRDQRVEQLEQQVLVTRQYITNLRARETRLMQDVQRYRPYSGKAGAPPLPEQLAAELVNTVNGLQVYEQELTKNMAEQQQLRAEFNADIARFRELKGAQKPQ